MLAVHAILEREEQMSPSHLELEKVHAGWHIQFWNKGSLVLTTEQAYELLQLLNEHRNEMFTELHPSTGVYFAGTNQEEPEEESAQPT
jgi:hypothetical protein